MNILVVGGTGTVGSQLVRNLVQQGHTVRVMSRTREKFSSLPSGAEGVVADLERAETLPRAFANVEAAFILNALAPNETEQGLAAVEAAKNAQVQRLVYLSVHNLHAAGHVGHFGKKIPVEQAIRESGIEYTILAPNNFFQNDLWYVDVVRNYGVYPQPIGSKGVSRVDVRDVADAAANALTKDGFGGKTYALNGPEAITGAGVASAYSEALGVTVDYAGDDLEAWAAQAAQVMPDWMVKDLREMYRHFQDEGFTASQEQLREQEALIGHAPRSFASFVRDYKDVFRA